MKITEETYSQAKKDSQEYDLYLKQFNTLIPNNDPIQERPKTFKEMFGYEIIIDPLEFIGERF